MVDRNIHDKGRLTSTHRASWEVHKGPIPEGLFVLHKCDVRHCVNPDHLFLGTRQDNMDDMVAKNRQAFGNRKHTAKLTEEAVREIRSSMLSQSTLAKQYGVTQSRICMVKNGKGWKHIT